MTAPVGPFFVRGVTKFVAVTSVANMAAPTRAEINGGTVLTEIVGVSGFQLSQSFVDSPTLDSAFTGNVAGEEKPGDSSLTFRDVRGDTTVRDALQKGDSLVIVKMPYGDYAGERCETWPVIVGGVNDTTDMGSYGQFVVSFSIPEPPVQNAVIPA